MFRNEKSFANKSQHLTEKAYEKLNNNQLIYFPSEGIKRTLNNLSLEIATLIIAFLGAKELFFDEKTSGKTTLPLFSACFLQQF